MRTPVDEFQIYLLSTMTNQQLVGAALRTFGVTEAEMLAVAAAFVASSKIEEIGHSAQLYTTLLGSPHSVRAMSSAETGETFAGSTRRTWVLPTWPAVDFVVNEHPQGWAWGERFEQRVDQL